MPLDLLLLLDYYYSIQFKKSTNMKLFEAISQRGLLIQMKTIIVFFSFLICFLIPKVILSQAMNAQVLESIFDNRYQFGDKLILVRLKLNQDSLYDALENKVKKILNLESIRRAQSQPFVFTQRKGKDFKKLIASDISKASENPADLYLIFSLLIDPPHRSLIYPLVRNTMVFKIYIYDKELNLTRLVKYKKRKTLGFLISSDDFNGSDDDYDEEDLDFNLDRDLFLELFDKIIKSKKSVRKIAF